MNRVEILGVQIDNVSWGGALERIRAMLRQGGPHQVITPAIEQVILSRRDLEFRAILEKADLVVADGMPLVFASHWHKTPLKERITGVDLVPAICQLAAEEKASVFFLGGEEGVAEDTAQCMRERYPGLNVAGFCCPPYGFEKDPAENERVLQVVQNTAPSILFVALGCPKQEKWIRRHWNRLNVPLMIGIGGAFNMITGREKRAPAWMQRWGLEALYRFYQRPGVVWRRVLINAPYFFLLLIDLFTYRTQKWVAGWMRPLLLGAGDALLAPLSFLFSYWFYFRSGVFSNAADPFADHPSLLNMPAYSDLMLVVSILAVASFWFLHLYERNKYITARELCTRVGKSSLLLVFLLICFQFLFFKHLFRESNFRGFSRMVFGFFGLFSYMMLVGWRWLFFQFEQFLHRYGVNLDRLILVGESSPAAEIAVSLNQHPEWGNFPIGVVLPSERSAMGKRAPVLGSIADLRRLLPARKVDEILVVDSNLPMKDLLEVVRLCRDFHVRLSVIPSIQELLGVSSQIKQMGDYRVITVALDRSVDPILQRKEK